MAKIIPKVKTKDEQIDETIKNLTKIKSFDEGSIMRLDSDFHVDVKTISTGSLKVDKILGAGGLPLGRIVEIYGGASCGKTTLALQVIAETQKNGGICAFIDTEHALDPKYAEALGVNRHDLLFSQPDSAEQALQMLEEIIKSETVQTIVIDSVAALVPRAELDGNVGEIQIGHQARLMSQTLRKIIGIIAKNNVLVIFINQTRQNIMTFGYGSPTTTSGGVSLSFYSSVRLELKVAQKLKQGENIIGSRVKVKTVKNKIAPPFKETICDIYYGEGFSKYAEALDLAIEYDIVEKTGSFYKYNGETIGHGITNAKEYLLEHKEIFEEIKEAIIKLPQW